MSSATAPFLVGLGWLAGCSCQPGLPSPDAPTETDTGAASPADTSTGDTAPAPPCGAPEIEPNDAVGTATRLPMETIGCGAFDAPLDLDYFAFDLDEEGWVQVKVWARPLGSVADTHLVVTADDGTAATRTDDEGTSDSSLTFPGRPQQYRVQLLEQNGNGETARYFYELVAAVTKPPVAWTRLEVEPNDASASAITVADGDVIFGGMGATSESDWYAVAIPPGKHTFTVDVDAYEFGSTGDFSLVLYNAALEPLPLGCRDCVIETPPDRFARDPRLVWDSPGNEVLYLRLFEDAGRSGDAVWYAMSVTLEGS